MEAKGAIAPSLSKRILAGDSSKDLVQPYVHDSPLIEVDHPYNIAYTCRCSRERVDRTITLLGRAAVAEMLLKGEAVPVTCQFCGQSYIVTLDDLRKIQRTLD